MSVYDYEISIGGTLVSTLAVHSRFLKYTSGMRRGSNLIIPHRHGEYAVPDKYFEGADVLLEVFLPSDTHAAAAETLSEIALLLSSQDLVTVSQVDPHRGAIRARVELLTDPTPTQNDFTYLFGLRNPRGFWEDVSTTTAASANPPSVTTGGDRPINDMVLTFSGPGFLQHTDPLGQVSRVEIESAAGAGTYILDVGAGTITKGGAPQDRYFIHTQPWVMKWQPNSVQSFTSNVAVAASWRNKWS